MTTNEGGLIAAGALSPDTARAVAQEATLVRTMMEAAWMRGRDDHAVLERARVAFSNPRLAAVAEYAIPRGGSNVTGASVHLARELARIHGSMSYGMRVVKRTPQMARVQGFAVDLVSLTSAEHEMEFELRVPRKRSGEKVYEWADPQQATELINSQGARCERNALLRLLPSSLVDEVLATVYRTLNAARASVPSQADVDQATSDFAALGVTVEDVERLAGALIDDWTKETLAVLFRYWTAIRDGHETVETLLEGREPEEGKPREAASQPKASGGTAAAKALEAVEKTKAEKPKAKPKPRASRAKPKGVEDLVEAAEAEEAQEPVPKGKRRPTVQEDYPDEYADRASLSVEELVEIGREAVRANGVTREQLDAALKANRVARLSELPSERLAAVIVALETGEVETYYPAP